METPSAPPSALLSVAWCILFTARYFTQKTIATTILTRFVVIAVLSFWSGPNNFILVLAALALYSFVLLESVANEWGPILLFLSVTLGPVSGESGHEPVQHRRVTSNLNPTTSSRKQGEVEHQLQAKVNDLQIVVGELKEDDTSVRGELKTRSPAEESAEKLSKQITQEMAHTPESPSKKAEARQAMSNPDTGQDPPASGTSLLGQSVPEGVRERTHSRQRIPAPPKAHKIRPGGMDHWRANIKADSLLREWSLGSARQHSTPVSDSDSILGVNEACCMSHFAPPSLTSDPLPETPVSDVNPISGASKATTPIDSAPALFGSTDPPVTPVSDRTSILGENEAFTQMSQEPRSRLPPSPPAITKPSSPKRETPQELSSEPPKEPSVPFYGVAEEPKVVKKDVGALLRSKSTKVEAADGLLPETVSAERSPDVVSHTIESSTGAAPPIASEATELKSILVDSKTCQARQLFQTSTTTGVLGPVKRVRFQDEALFDSAEDRKFPNDGFVADASTRWTCPGPEIDPMSEPASVLQSIAISETLRAHHVTSASECASEPEVALNLNGAPALDFTSAPQPDDPPSIDALNQVAPAPAVNPTAESISEDISSDIVRYTKGPAEPDHTPFWLHALFNHAASGCKHPAFAIMDVEGLPERLPKLFNQKCDYYLPPLELLYDAPLPVDEVTKISKTTGDVPPFLLEGFGPELTGPQELQCGLHAICQALQDLRMYSRGMYSIIKERLQSLEGERPGWGKNNYAAEQMNKAMVDLYDCCIATVTYTEGNKGVWCYDHGHKENDVGKTRLYIYQRNNHFESISRRGRRFILTANRTSTPKPITVTHHVQQEAKDTKVTMVAASVLNVVPEADLTHQGKRLQPSYMDNTGICRPGQSNSFGSTVAPSQPHQEVASLMLGNFPTQDPQAMDIDSSGSQSQLGNVENGPDDIDMRLESLDDSDRMDTDEINPDEDISMSDAPSKNFDSRGALSQDIHMDDA